MCNHADTVQSALEKIRAGVRELSHGPVEFYLLTLCEHSRALFDRFAPFHAGDRVVIVQKPDCDNAWRANEHDLQVGATGVVCDVHYSRNRFYADVILDRETYTYNGQRLEVRDRHTFALDEHQITRVEVDP